MHKKQVLSNLFSTFIIDTNKSTKCAISGVNDVKDIKMNRTQQTTKLNNINISELMKNITILTEKVNSLENAKNYTGWMTIKRAAFLVGLSRDALAQRIVNHDYAEEIVWRQNGKGCSIMINLKELNKVI